MKISIFGIGYVGVVSAACLAKDGHDVIAVDVDPGKVNAINEGKTPIVEEGIGELVAEVVAAGRLTATTDTADAITNTDASFICVGTPSAPDGSVGLTYVEDVCRNIGAALKNKDTYHSVVVRSTVVPGSTETCCIPVLEECSGKTAGEGFGLGYYPEFLRESTAIQDNYNPGLIVFGYMDQGTKDILTALNDHLPCEINKVDIRTAEMIKYTSNAWRAVKVTFANEIGRVWEAAGADPVRVMQIVAEDTKLNISPVYLRPGFAFGGSCLPKDLRALTFAARDQNVGIPMLDHVIPSNEVQIRRAFEAVRESGKRQVALLGLAFKAGTDDLREAPMVEVAERLIGKGLKLSIYDHNVSLARLTGANARFIHDHLPHIGELLVDDVERAIEGAEAVVIGNSNPDFADVVAGLGPDIHVIDLVRVVADGTDIARYHGLGW